MIEKNQINLEKQTDEITENLSCIDKEKTSQRKKRSVIGIVIGIVVVGIVVFFIYNTQKASAIDKELELGEKYLEVGLYEEAKLTFDKVLEIDNKVVKAFEGKAEAAIGLEEFQEAENILIEAKEIKATDQGHLLLAEVYLNTDRYDEATTIYDESFVTIKEKLENDENLEELTKDYEKLIEVGKKEGRSSKEVNNLCSEAYEKTGNEEFLKKKKSENGVGNINNGGYTYIENNWIYYSDEEKEGLFKIKSDGTEKMKLTDANAISIFIEDDWIYYIDISKKNINNEYLFNRIKTDGTQQETLFDKYPCREQYVSDDFLYGYHETDGYTSIYRHKFDRSEHKTLANTSEDGGIVMLEGIRDEWVYFQSFQGGSDKNYYINKVKMDGSQKEVVYTSIYPVDDILITEDKIIFSTVTKEDQEDNKILGRMGNDICFIREDEPGTINYVIPNEPVKGLNVLDEWVYYFSEQGLKKVCIDGRGEVLLSQSLGRSINVVGNWIYFKKYLGKDSKGINQYELYRIRTDGTMEEKV